MLIYKVEWIPNVPPTESSGETPVTFKVQRGEDAATVWLIALQAATAKKIIGAPGGLLRLSFVCDPDACYTERE